jgi:peptidoglycan/LPS O-acetylase OafA/YrhL
METNISKMKLRNRLDALTSFRFFAALMVFLFHVEIFSKYQLGYIGVSFFFILSGFILTYNYSSKLRSLDRTNIKKFYIARLTKIYPIHLITFILAIPYYFFIPLKHDPILYIFQGLTNLLLIHSWIPFGNISFNGVSWSLSDEMFFYLIFPLVIIFLQKFKTRKRVLISTLVSIYVLLLFVLLLMPINNNFAIWFAYYFPLTRSLEFGVGILLGLFFLRVVNKLSELSTLFFTIFEIISLSLLVMTIYLSDAIPQNLRYGTAFIPFMSLLIISFAFQKGKISKLISNKLFIYLGEISFSFYMLHNLILSYIFFLWKPSINNYFLIGICFLLTVFLSSLMYSFYEEPVRLKLKNLLIGKIVRDPQGKGVNKKVV